MVATPGGRAVLEHTMDDFVVAKHERPGTIIVAPACIECCCAEALAGAEVWVLPSPSGLNANHQLPDLVKLFRALRSRKWPPS